MALTLSQINIYPVKSLSGITVDTAFAGLHGLQHDRRWLIVDDNNNFLTQRELSSMALIKTNIIGDGIYLSHKLKSEEECLLPLEFQEGEPVTVRIWEDTVEALHYSKTADEWVTNALSKKCRLVYMPDNASRPLNSKYGLVNDNVSFADAFPYLIIGENSLAYLNKRLEQPILMNRFRPNFVFSGGLPFEEDQWKDFTIGEVTFKAVKPCVRCIITTINQEDAKKDKEPLKTLATFREFNNNIHFGMNLIALTNGTINVSDNILLI